MTSKLSTTQEALEMSSLVPIGVLAENTLPNIAMKVASESLAASQTRMTKEAGNESMYISKRGNLEHHQCNSSNT